MNVRQEPERFPAPVQKGICMRRRPVCLVCLALMFLMCITDLAGIPLIRGNPLPESVQKWIGEHPKTVICGEVQSCQDTEFSFSVYLKQVFLINRSEKFPIENVRVFLKTKEVQIVPHKKLS